MIGLMFTILS